MREESLHGRLCDYIQVTNTLKQPELSTLHEHILCEACDKKCECFSVACNTTVWERYIRKLFDGICLMSDQGPDL